MQLLRWSSCSQSAKAGVDTAVISGNNARYTIRDSDTLDPYSLTFDKQAARVISIAISFYQLLSVICVI